MGSFPSSFTARHFRDEDVPQTALLAAAFFIASQIHVRVGPSSAHLLLNGLVGVILGRRAVLAILVGLALQAILFVPDRGRMTQQGERHAAHRRTRRSAAAKMRAAVASS